MYDSPNSNEFLSNNVGNVCYEMNTTSEPSKTLCEPVQDIVKRSPTDCIYRISANVACSQNTASLSTVTNSLILYNFRFIMLRK
jgi:hypothetical protein